MQSPAPVYRDALSGLRAFGIIEIVLGCLMALMIPVMILGQAITAKQQGGEADWSMLASSFVTFSTGAVALIWLGFGSMKAKRWARALLLCLGWLGLIFGAMALVVVLMTLGSMDEAFRQSGQELPASAVFIAKAIGVGVVFVMYIVIPGALVLFYRSRNVKLTCEHRDPVSRWTDRCPLPVLAWCLVQAYVALSVLFMWRFGNAVPLFGFIATGWIARVIWTGFAVFCVWGTWGFYRLNRRVWTIYSSVLVLGGLSTLITFSQTSILDYYRLVGLSEAQVKLVAVSPLVQGNNFLWYSGLCLVLGTGWLLYLRRYFLPVAEPSRSPAP